MTSVSASMRRLRALNDKCGGNAAAMAGDKFVMETDTTGMSRYAAQQVKVAERMRYLHGLMRGYDELLTAGGASLPMSQKAEASNRIRKELNALKSDTREAGRLAVAEKRRAEYEELERHVKRTEQRHRSRFGMGDDGYGSTADHIGHTQANKHTMLRELDDLPPAGASLREDEEFAQFFEQVQQGDRRIDEALDRIGEGVQRLQQNATTVRDELRTQQALLDETEQKVDKVSSNLSSVNKKLVKTLKEVDKDKMCIYLFCFLLLLGLAGGIYYVISDNK